MIKHLLAVCVLVFFMGLITVIILTKFWGSDAQIKLSAPENYQVGDLVVLDATSSVSERLQWTILPETKNFKIVGKTAYFSSSAPDRYTVIITATNNGTLATKVFFLEPGTKNLEVDPKRIKLLIDPNIKRIRLLIDGGIIDSLDAAVLAASKLGLSVPDFKTFDEFKKWIEDNS